jgi:hypothetical protein
MPRSREIVSLSELGVESSSREACIEYDLSRSSIFCCRASEFCTILCMSQGILCHLFADFCLRLIVGYSHPIR